MLADGTKKPIDCFTADNMTEAKEALRWLKEHHPERDELNLGGGEFFEILEEDFCLPAEWERTLEIFKQNKERKGFEPQINKKKSSVTTR